MPDYRAYLLDSAGHIRAVRIVTADDDAAALAAARALPVGGSDIEVWEEGRRVGTLKGDALHPSTPRPD